MKYKLCLALAALLVLPLQTKVFGQTSAHTAPLASKTLSPAQVPLNWVNQTGSDITINWVNFEGKTQEGQLVKPGEAYQGISYAGNVFRVFLLDKDRQSQILPTITVSAANASAPIVSTMSLRSTTLSPAQVPLNWVNQTDEDIVIHWVDYEGHMQGGQVVKPGEAYQDISYAGHVFRVFPKVMTSQKQEYWPLIVSAAPLPAAPFLKGFTGPTTKRELNIKLPFAKAQKLTVEVANDGTVIFERDMIVGKVADFTQQNVMIGKVSNFTRSSRPVCDASEANPKIWPNSTIPYSIPRHSNQDEILAAIKEINSVTNLCLVPRTNETDYVEFVSKNGNWSTVGRVGGRQEISIDSSEPYHSIALVAHEIMHTAGFSHTQSREDRNGYVTINDRNIVPGMEHNFQRLTDKASNIGPYDFTSIMHYPAKGFSKNGRNTIDLKGGGDTSKMGTRQDDLSPGDIAVVATIYAPAPCKTAGEKPTAPKPPQPTAPKPPQPTTTDNDNTGNIAIGKKAYQGDGFKRDSVDAKKAIDGNTDGRFDKGSVTQTGEGRYLFWEIDLGAVYDVSRIVIWNRTDEGFRDLQQNFLVATTDEAFFRDRMGNSDKDNLRMSLSRERNSDVGNFGPFSPWAANKANYTVPINRKARWIRISTHAGDGEILPGLSLAEVQVFGTPVPVPGIRKR